MRKLKDLVNKDTKDIERELNPLRTSLLLTPCDELRQLTRGMPIFILLYGHVYVLLCRWIAGIEISSKHFDFLTFIFVIAV